MFRPPTDADGAFPVELVQFVEGDSSNDIDFGGRRPHDDDPARRPREPKRRGWSRNTKLGAAAAAAALVVIAFVVGADGGTHHAAAPVTTPVRPSVSVDPAVGLGPVLMNDQGWALYFANQSSGRQVTRLDLATGKIAAVADAVYNPSLRISGSGASARIVQSTDVGGATAQVPGPQGATWLTGIDGSTTGLSLVRTQQSTGLTVLANYDLGDLSAVFQGMIGSMANGEPVFAAPDGSAFVYNPATGSKYRLANGLMVSAVTSGNYGDVECDPSGNCRLLIHGDSHTYSMFYSSQATFSISPDGGHALVTVMAGDAMTRTMVNIKTGVSVELHEQPDASGADDAPASSAVWAPDGMTAFFVNGSQLVKVSSDGMWTQRIELPSSVPAGSVAVGVA